MLHIRCGSDILDRLRSLDRGPAIEWCDPVCQGPTPRTATRESWLDIRAAFLDAAYPSGEPARARLTRQDAALMQARDHDETVLWFEADLFDQAILIALLDRFSQDDLSAVNLSLICIGDYPGIDRFVGLGQLSAEQLASVLPGRPTVVPTQRALARAAWEAMRAPEPTELHALLGHDLTPLPFLADAIRRHLAELPDRLTGLSLTESYVLGAVAEGAERPEALFCAASEMEACPWLGDIMLWVIVENLCAGPAALLVRHGPEGWRRDAERRAQTRFELTELGARVHAGAADWRAHAAPGRWVGGVHLHGGAPDWRWDRETGGLVRL